MADIFNAYMQGRQFRTQQDALTAQQDQKRRLAELLPQAVQGNQQSINELAGIDPDLFVKLDDRQREQAKAEASELVNAVQWADTPEKWAQAQQYLGSKGMDVSGYGFDQREQYLLQAGKIGQLLESRPKPTADPSSVREYEYARQQGFDGNYMDYVKTRYPGAPVVLGPYDTMEGGGAPAPARPKGPPQPGEVVGGFRFKGGNPNDRNSWEPAGGQTASPSGAFPASGS